MAHSIALVFRIHFTLLGVLACLDGYLNMALEQSEEYGVDGLLKAKYGDCFIRGNNGKPLRLNAIEAKALGLEGLK